MTCASCVRRVEKVLAKLDGVELAEVNLATEAASVVYDPNRVGPDQMAAAIATAGYTGQLRPDPRATPSGATGAAGSAGPLSAADDRREEHDRARDAELAGLKRKWQVTLTTGLTLMALMYVPLPIDTMDWLMPVILVVTTGRPVLGRQGVLRPGVGRRQARRHQHEHPGRARHPRRVRLQRVRHAVARAGAGLGAAAARVLRDVAGHPRAGHHGALDGRARRRSRPRPPSRPSSGSPRRPPGCCATAPRSTSRSRTSSWATWSGSGPARRSRSTASSRTGRPAWTRAC